MPYPMIHLEVAYRLSDRYDWLEKKADFLLGSVAPDAVHFNENYHVHSKEISHVWDCGPVWGVTLDSKKWKNNILAFWKQHREDAERDFIAGYCVHLLTDWLNDLRMWAPFRMKIIQGGNYDEVYSQSAYREEANGFDKWMYRHNVHTEEIWRLLAKGRVQGLHERMLAEDLGRQKESLLTEQYLDAAAYDISKYQYYTKELIDSFMTECVAVIEKELR